MRHITRAVGLGIAAIAAIAAPARAQTIVNADRAEIAQKIVVGSSTFGDVLRVVGAGTIGGGTGTMNPWVLDSEGDALRDTGVTVSTGGMWTFGNLNLTAGDGTGTGLINLNGLAASSKGFRFLNSGTLAGQISVTDTVTHFDLPGSLLIRNGAGSTERADLTSTGDWTTRGHIKALGTSAVPTAAVGSANARIGVAGGAPRLILETVGFDQWELDNVNGLFRLVRMNAAGTVDNRPLQIDGNININPYGKFVLPVDPYSISFGSPQKKFAAAWFADLFVDTLIANENIGTTGGRWLIGQTNILDADVSSSQTSILVRYNNFTNGQFVYAEKNGRTEFMQITSVATPVNQVGNPSFEDGSTSGWGASLGVALSNSTAKSFRGNRSMFVNTDPTTTLVLYSGMSLAEGTQYTACLYMRRVDGTDIPPGEISFWMRDSYQATTVEKTGTDGWFRLCRTATATSAGAPYPYLHFTTSNNAMDYYVDAVQIEATSIARPYSDTRSTYTVTRNVDGGGANEWYAGDAVFNTGGSAGFGWLDCYAIRGMKSSAEFGPTCVANVRTGTAFNNWEPYAAWGQLNGTYGYGSSIFGFAAGPYSGVNLTLDPTNGLRVRNSTTNRMALSPSSLTFYDSAGTSRMALTTSALDFNDSTGAQIVRIDTDSGGRLWIGKNVSGAAQFAVTSTQAMFCRAYINCPIVFDGTTGNILLSTGGNIVSTGEWNLSRGNGLRVERNVSVPGYSAAHALSMGEAPAYDDLRIYTINSGEVNILKGLGNLVIGDQGYTSSSGQPSRVSLRSDGTSSSPGLLRGNDLTVGPDGILFDYHEDTFAGASNVEYVRPVKDGLMRLGHPSARWRTIHLNLAFNSTPSYVVVNDPSDGSALGAAAGYTGTKVMGACTTTWYAGLLMSVSGC